MNKPLRHVGGSILPSSSSRILQPVDTPKGTLQVRVIPELDTHALVARHGNGESLLATHPNGFSCHVLLTELQRGNRAKAEKQIAYILDCGGTARNVDSILHYLSEEA
ncbi:hypothetical protein [Bradyrhizobium sp. SZCCHNS3053]|uniref:hypothetical protein n=1 Tax=Bradyrhizobium sp. SZCCHNS3053 TaxID=3057322 RepID=UPI0029165C1C|nr:hypothetical protein [Bradyrhizobium sp. SZCCHNS3053]